MTVFRCVECEKGTPKNEDGSWHVAYGFMRLPCGFTEEGRKELVASAEAAVRVAEMFKRQAQIDQEEFDKDVLASLKRQGIKFTQETP